MRAPLLALALLLSFLGVVPCASAGERTLTFFSKPIVVAPYTAKQEGMSLRPNGVEAPDTTGFITRMDADVVPTRSASARSLSIQDVMIHHLVYANGQGGWGQESCFGRFFARGEEHQVFQLPDGYGLPNRNVTSAGPPDWTLVHMLMNHRPRAKKVFVRVRVTMSDDPLTAVDPLWIDTRQCDADPVFDVPGGGRRGSKFVDREAWTVPRSGRIVAAGGHLHGGGKFSRLRSATCDGRTLVNSRAYYGGPRHPFYRVRPILHEASPIRMGLYTSAAGIPVSRGERLVLEAGYDNSYPHTRVMSIMMAAFVPDEGVQRCGPLPTDMRLTGKPSRYRARPPRFIVPLVKEPAGAFRPLRRALGVGNYFFRPERIRTRAGRPVTWRFDALEEHSVAVANGPRGFSSPWITRGSYTFTPRVRGRYRLFCSLHPAAMTQELEVD